MILLPEELARYDRQIMIDEIGVEGQKRLKSARLLIAGCGGLGSPAAIYLAAAGVGTIRIVDCDEVEISNLNRQVLHWERDIGRRKVDSAREKLMELNHGVRIEAFAETITEENISTLADGFEGIIDAMDNLDTRFILNQYAIEKRIPFFHGAVRGFEGRAMTILPGRSACLRCLYRGSIAREKFPVIGVAPAVIGAIQATEAIKFLLGIGNLLASRLLLFDGLRMKFEEFSIKRNPECDHCGCEE